MADTKITALAAITTVDPAADVLPIVDISDTSMAASGTTKKITSNQILGAGGTATLASATITGDLTVDTSTLKVDSANNRVGIGTASPVASFQATLSGLYGLRIQSADTNNSALNIGNDPTSGYAFIDATKTGSGSFLPLRFSTSDTERYRIAADGVATWQNVGGVAGTAMTLNANGLGIGVTPSAWTLKAVQIVNGGIYGSGNETGYYANAFYGSSGWRYINAAGASGYLQNGGSHQWYRSTSANVAGTDPVFDQAMTLDASGNLLVTKTALNSATVGIQLEAVGAVTSTRSAGAAAYFNRLSSDGFLVLMGRESSIVGDISVTTTGTTFNSTSDYRLKEAVAPLSGGLARVNALKPSIYKWKSNGSNGEGFLAHELAEVVPAAVTGEKDAVNEDGSIKAQSIDMSRVVPILVAAIQELTARVQTLEAK